MKFLDIDVHLSSEARDFAISYTKQVNDNIKLPALLKVKN